MISTETKVVTIRRCDKKFKSGFIHGLLPDKEETCPFCDECEHGVNRYGHCDKCNPDKSWAWSPITDQELAQIENRPALGMVGFRSPNTPRNYQAQDLFTLLLQEYKQLRSKSL
jgi:hypothetical protein